MRALDRPRTIALVAGLLLAIGGGALAAFAPEPPVYVPVAPGASADAPRLRYLFSLPDAGDAPFSRPVGVAVGAGRVYVTDSDAGVVRSFSTAGPDAGEIGRGVLEVPAYVAKDATDGSLLVTDRARRAVLRFDTDGELLGEVRPSGEASGTWEPLGVATDGEGAIAVTDASARHRVVVMDESGEVTLTLGGSGIPVTGNVGVALEYPNTVAFGADGIWVGDSNNRRVLAFDREGRLVRVVRVSGVARGLAFVESQERTFAAVVDTLTSEIVLLDAEGNEAARFGGPGSDPGKLAYPNDVAYEPGTRRLYVADTVNARVQVWEAVSAEQAAEDAEGGPGVGVSAMRMAGFIAIAVGSLLAAAALWPGPVARNGSRRRPRGGSRRRSRGTEVARG